MSKEFNWLDTKPTPIGGMLSMFESGDILVTVKEGSLYGTQYYYNGVTLMIVGNDPAECDNFQCQKEKLKEELFMKLGSATANGTQIDAYRNANDTVIKLIKANGGSLSKKDAIRLPKLNKSADLETVILVHNILKARYNVDIQREGVLT